MCVYAYIYMSETLTNWRYIHISVVLYVKFYLQYESNFHRQNHFHDLLVHFHRFSRGC
jgi:hypothetical protein